jgi:hypothetical protein
MPNSGPTDNETFKEPVADRAPTPEEERAADEAAVRVDVDEVAEHYEEMTELGAKVRGEGQIDAD